MTQSQVDDLDLGPIDYLVVEYPNGRPTGEALPYLMDLIDRGLVRILDFAVVAKDADGGFRALTWEELPAGAGELELFQGAETGILDDEDIAQVAGVIDNGSVGAIVVYENSWAGPFAGALRRAGAQLVASGRIPVQAVLDALDALDETGNA